MTSHKFTRRDFLKAAGISAAYAASMSPFGSKLLMASPRLQDIINISFGGWGGVAEDEGVRAAIEVFQQENPGIAVAWQHTPDANEYNRVLLTNFAAGTTPDTSFIIADGYETYRNQGILLDITDRITSDPLLGQPDYFLPQEAFRCADGNGRWHGIGSCWVAHHIYYNAALFEEEGITPPGFADDEIWDWDTFVQVAKQLTVDSAGLHPDDDGFNPEDIQRWGVDWPMTWWQPVAAAVHSNGGMYFQDGKMALDSPEAMEALQRLSDLIYVHHVAPRSASIADLGMTNTQMVDNGRLAMAIDGSWALSWMNSSLVSVPVGTGALPKMKQPVTIMQAHFHSVLSNTPNPDQSWEWVRYLSTPFYQTQFLKIGLWLPSQTALLTEEGLDSWITEGIHPANYRQFVSEYIPQYGVSVRIPPGYVEAAANFIDGALQAVAAGTPVVDVIPEAVRQGNDVMAMAVL